MQTLFLGLMIFGIAALGFASLAMTLRQADRPAAGPGDKEKIILAEMRASGVLRATDLLRGLSVQPPRRDQRRPMAG